MRGSTILLLAASLLLVGCPDTSGLYDFDNDGFIDAEDCGSSALAKTDPLTLVETDPLRSSAG